MYKIESFRLAENFHRVGEDIIPDDWLDNENDDYHWFIPSIVNLAFSCELYIKSLVFDDNTKERKEHNWTKLIKQRKDLYSIIKSSSIFKDDTDFDLKIAEGGQLFTDWRYIFERGKEKRVDIIFLENFACVLHDLAESEINLLMDASDS